MDLGKRYRLYTWVAGTASLGMGALRTRIDSGDAAKLVPFGMSVFWAINAGYQSVIPFPMPHSMQAVRWSLLAFPIFVAVCYGTAYVAATRRASGGELRLT